MSRRAPRNDNAGKLANQVKKALRITAIVDAIELADGIDPHAYAEQIADVLRRAPHSQWAAMAVMQGETPPSDETKALVLDVYAARARARKLAEMLEPVISTHTSPCWHCTSVAPRRSLSGASINRPVATSFCWT